ncbi:MAG: 3'(2'),5'-bisphosphate nucleotidase CysQ [Pseudomonadota bacterium]
MPYKDDHVILREIISLSLQAGQEALNIYASDFEVEIKEDTSPVTTADKVGEEIILSGLNKYFNDIPVIAEEAAADGHIPELRDPHRDTFFLVDPLDGTKEFVKRTDEFTVNIALIRGGKPVLGAVYAPALGKLYSGRYGDGASLYSVDEHGSLGDAKSISARVSPDEGLTAVASRSHRTAQTDEYLETLNVVSFAAAGSSLKFCLLAEGRADIYPRFGRTMEWDTGAGQAVLEAAGGRVISTLDEKPLMYGKVERGFDNPHFVAWGAA